MQEINHSKGPDFSTNGVCTEGCAQCCTSVLPVSGYELQKLHRFVKRNSITPTHLNKDCCPFLGTDKKCQVYIHRPEICRSFMCNTHIENFDHSDKHIVAFWTEFFPNLVEDLTQEELQKLDSLYQLKKKG